MALAGPVTLVDGLRAESVPVTDRGLLYGDGVFETIRLHQQKPVLLAEHLARMARGCHVLGLDFSENAIVGQLALLLREKEVVDHHRRHDASVLKIIITRGDGGRGYAPPAKQQCRIILQLHAMPGDHNTYAAHGISCVVCEHPVSENLALAGIKHLNRLDQVVGSRELRSAAALDATVQEGLMCNSRGELIEGTRSNVFLTIAGRVCTPDLGAAGVDGIMRQALLAWWQHQGSPVDIRTIKKGELQLATEVLICNSVIGVWPVNSIRANINSDALELRQHTLARAAQQHFRTLLST